MPSQSISGAELVVEQLKKLSVELIFGYPGGAILPLYDALYNSDIQHVLVRHEQGSVHAANGYARMKNKPGVVISTSGPGATNLITGIADAILDSIPILVITGQVQRTSLGNDAFQEVDIIGLSNPITKYNYQVLDIREIPYALHKAYAVANSGRKGPVVVDISKTALTNTITRTEVQELEQNLNLRLKTSSVNNQELYQATMQHLMQAKKPLLLIGGGVVLAQANAEVKQFAEKYQIPMVTSLLGLSAIEHDNPLFVGMVGMHGCYAANLAVTECDFLLNIGCRFSDRLVAIAEEFAKDAKVVHIDIDPAEINKIIATDIAIIADAKEALTNLLNIDITKPSSNDWLTNCRANNTTYPLKYTDSDTEIKPQKVIELISQFSQDDAVIVTDVGQHQMWTSQYFKQKKDTILITSGGMGTMGFGIPAAIGAQFANPEREVILVVGDGGFQMTNQELILITQYRLKLKIILINNNVLGMVRQWQTLFFNQHYSASEFDLQPDFAKLAESYGLANMVINNPKTLKEQLQQAINAPHSILVEVIVSAEEQVMPMIEPGCPNYKMIGV